MSTAGPILIENIKTEYRNLTFTPAQFETEIVQAQLEMMLESQVPQD